MPKQDTGIFYPKTTIAWRKWLEKNHQSKKSVWVVFYKKGSGKKSITWSEAVDVALCYGWIDSKKIKIDDEVAHQYFSQRKAKSTWSKINKDKVEQLIQKGLMTDAGYKSIEIAKQNGSWTFLDDVEKLVIPQDLENEFSGIPNSKEYFLSLSKSTQKLILYWVVAARLPATRQNRIREVATLAGRRQKPGQL